MKRMLLAAAALLLVLGCTSLPAPEGVKNSLVVGRIALDFPDGFFDRPARTLQARIKMDFLNLASGSKFTVYTSDGYFFFLSNGSDTYRLLSYASSAEGGGGGYTIGPATINKVVPMQPGRVMYLGDLTITYAQPKKTESRSSGTYWDFDVSRKLDWNPDELERFIRDMDPESPWLEREVVKTPIYGL